MTNIAHEALVFNNDKYVTAKQIPEVLSSIGIERGFSKASLYRKLADGTFDVPYHISGRTKLWKPSEIIAWWNRQPRFEGPDRKIISK
tara:strand:- start:151 stop:414 length:264 start_codon:yes stop_codon:yes gene_type:complete